jgi:acetolactate synthase-1/2/3 large subunit
VRLLLWNNSGYGEIKSYMVGAGVAPVGVDIHTPDFAPITRGFGWAYRKIASVGELAAALATPAGGNEVIEIDEAAFTASAT